MKFGTFSYKKLTAAVLFLMVNCAVAFAQPTISAKQLRMEYDENSIRFEMNYNGKLFYVSGKITYIGKDFLGSYVVRLDASGDGWLDVGYVEVTYPNQKNIPAKTKNMLANLEDGQRFTELVKGTKTYSYVFAHIPQEAKVVPSNQSKAPSSDVRTPKKKSSGNRFGGVWASVIFIVVFIVVVFIVGFIIEMTKEISSIFGNRSEKYKKWNIGNWDDNCWKTFYAFLTDEIGKYDNIGSNDETPKNGRKTLSFHWYSRRWRNQEYNIDYTVYLQIERRKIYFKIDAGEDGDSERRQAVKRMSIARMKDEILPRKNIPEIEHPKKVAWSGNTMVLASVKRENWLGEDFECVDTEKVLERLHIYEKILEEFVGIKRSDVIKQFCSECGAGVSVGAKFCETCGAQQENSAKQIGVREKSKEDCYGVLGIPQNASVEDVKRAYRQLAVKYHPDKNPGDRDAVEKFREVTDACKTLLNIKENFMPFCTNCGADITEEVKFCMNCGKPIDRNVAV